MAKKKLIPLRGENAQVKSSGGEVINIESEPIRPNRFLQDEFDMAPGRRTIEGLAEQVAAENQRRRTSVSFEGLQDMRPSYMRQQAVPAVPQSQVSMNSLLQTAQRGGNQERNEVRAQSFNDYASTVRRARADADGFQQAVERGRGMTHNGLDADLDYKDALGFTSRRDKRTTAMGALTWRTPENEAKTNSMLSDQEKQNYYYLAATQGRQEAENYRQYLLEKNDINKQLGQERYERVKDASLPVKAVTAFNASMAGAADQTSNVGNAVLGRASIKAATPAEHLAQAIEQGENDTSTIRGRVAHKAIQLANTAGTNMPSMVAGAVFTPGVGSAMFATQAAGAAYQEVINNGGTVQQAQEYAALQAVDEEITNALLGGIAERGGGMLKNMLKDTALARNLHGVLRGAFTNNPVGLHVAEGFINALADGGSEAAQEYVQYFTERFEKWLATGEAPTYNVNGEQKTYEQLAAELGQQGAIESIAGNPEAIESALMGFLNAELMGGVRGAGNTLNTLQMGNLASADAYAGLADSVNPNVLQYRSEDTYRKGKEVQNYARDQIRRAEAGRENSLSSVYGRGLMLQAAQEYADAVAETEMDDMSSEDALRQAAEERLANARPDHENAIDRTNRIRAALRGDNAQAAWDTVEDTSGRHEFVIPADTREQAASDLLESQDADRVSWNTEQGEVELDRESDGSYTFTNERGESVTMDAAQAVDLIPAGQNITVQSAAAETAPSTEAEAPSTAPTTETTAPTTETTAPSTAAVQTAAENVTKTAPVTYREKMQEAIRNNPNSQRLANERAVRASQDLSTHFGEAGQKLFKQMDPKTAVQNYRAFSQVYNYARFGGTMELSNEASMILGPEATAAAIRAGNEDANAAFPEQTVSSVRNAVSKVRTTGTAGRVTFAKGAEYKNLTNQQKLRADYAGALITKVLGMDVYFVQSSTKDGRYQGMNGSYSRVNGRPTITLDVNAGMNMESDWTGEVTDIKTMLPVISHELTHWMEKSHPDLYREIQNAVISTLANDSKYSKGVTINAIIAAERQRLNETVRDENGNPVQHTNEDAIHELVARACEEMLSGSKQAAQAFENLDAESKNTLWNHIKEVFNSIREFFEEMLGSYRSDSLEAKAIRRNMEEFEKIRNIWQQALNGGEYAVNPDITSTEFHDGIGENGINISSDSVQQFSERTYEEGGRKYLDNWLKRQVKSNKITEQDRTDIMRALDEMKRIMEDIRTEEGAEVDAYSRWADTRAKEDRYKDDSGKWQKAFTAIVNNGEYKMNIDFSTVCKKRTALNSVLNAMVTSGNLNFETLTASEVVELNNIIKEEGFEIACALCFVDSKRYRIGSWAESFCEGSGKDGKAEDRRYGWNEIVRSMVPEGSGLNIADFNFTNRTIENNNTNLLSDYKGKVDMTLINEIKKNFGKTTEAYRMADTLQKNPSMRKLLAPAEMISSAGLDLIKAQNKTLFKLINSHQGTAKPKLAFDNVAYNNDILKTQWTPGAALKVGGVRLQSFSDFQANMIFDYVQMVGEMQAKGLSCHSYTKEASFVAIFGKTGIKINMSLVPKSTTYTAEQVAKMSDSMREKLKATAGLDKDGNYIWEDETFPYEVAMHIQADPEYAKNCGTIAVGVSDPHIRKLLADPRIQMVIPYHKSSINHVVAALRNIALYNDYTDFQNTRTLDGKKLDGVPDFDFYAYMYGLGDSVKATKKDGSYDASGTNANIRKLHENWKNGKIYDGKTVANAYLDWCEKKGEFANREGEVYLPRFDQFAYNEDGTRNENYYKLLADFRLYDENGNPAPQQAVQSVYPDNVKDLVVNGYKFTDGDYHYENGGLKNATQVRDDLTRKTPEIIKRFKEFRERGYSEGEIAIMQQAGRTEVALEERMEEIRNSRAQMSLREDYDESSPSMVSDSGVQYSHRITDEDTLDRLNKEVENGDYIVTYKAMQKIGDELYPPMAAKVKGEDGKYRMQNPSRLNVWQEADEDTSHIKFKKNQDYGYYVLNKGDGSSVEAAYNPYEHSSNLVLNDQFEGAYKRDNLVVVKCIIPKSEIYGENRYKAQYAKDSTGVLDWKSGVVAGQLKDNKRQVYLSRYLMPVEIVPTDEVARMWKDTLKGSNVVVPFNVVQPSLLKELEKVGIPIDYEGSPIYKAHHKNSNQQYSMRDSAGNELTEAQAEYFKDSKARDEDGNLLTLYHGTGSSGFTEFRVTPGRGIWLTTSKRDADSYAGNFEGKLFDPNEAKSKGKSSGGSVRIGNNLRFENQEDMEQFLKENPDAKDYLSDRELMEKRYALDDLDWDELDEAEDEYNRLKRINRSVGGAYERYEMTHSQKIPLSEMLDHPERYSLGDVKRAWYTYDRNADLDDEFDYSSDDEFKQVLIDGLKDVIEERADENGPEWREDMLNMQVYARIPEGMSGEIATRTNRTYALYANVVNPYVFDNEGRGSEGNGRFYHTIEKAMADPQYDGVIVENARVGRYQDLGTVVLVKNPNQVKMTSNQNPTENPDLRYSQRNVDLDKRIDALVKKYGAIPKGEKPARNVDVPMQTSDNKNTRRFVRTILESGITSADLDDNIKSAIINESLSYEVATDKDAAEYAASVIRIGGVERAQREWDKARRSDTFNKDHMALGQFLLKEYAKNNDIDNAMNMIQDLAAEGTRMGQNIQAMRMLKKYAQQVPAIGLGYIQRTVDQMNREAKAKMGKRYKEMKIAPNLATEYINAQTRDEIDAALGKIYKNLGSQVQKTVPEEIIDHLRTWRYMSMLGNPRTHIRNLVGNALFVPAVTLKNAIGAELEGRMKSATRTKSLTVSKQAMEFAKKDAVEMKDVLSGESEKSIRDLIMDQRKVYKFEPLNKASKGNSAALEAEDWVFLRWHYQNSLAQYITANNLDVTEQNPSWLGRARNYAVQEAQKATYRDANKVSTWLNQSKTAGAVVKYMMEGLMPFKKTPTNILRRGIEYSPAGLVRTMSKGIYDLNTGKMTVNEWIDALSSGLSGTAIFGLGMFLASTGAILGGYEDDDDKELRKLKGLQEYSVMIGNHTYTIDWAAPGSLPLFIGVETMNALRQERGMTMDDMGKAAAKLIDPMINMSMLSGLNDTLDAISYADDKLSAATMEMFYSLLGQYVPTMLGQVARTIDTTQRINYQDVNTGMSKNMLYFIEKMQNKIPYLTFSNDPYLNEFGQENSGTPHWAAALQNFVSPGYISEIKDDRVIDEVARLNAAQDAEKVLPKKMPKFLGTKEDRVDLTSAQYHTFQKTAGQTAYNIIDRMIDDGRYNKLTAEQQANAIKMAYDYSKAVGRIAVQPEYEGKLTGDAKKVYGDVRKGMQAYDSILNRTVTGLITDGVEADTKDGKTVSGTKEYNTIDKILAQPISNTEKAKVYETAYPSEQLDNWKKGGGTTYDFMMGTKLEGEISKLPEEKKKKTYEYVVSAKGYTNQQKVAWFVSGKSRIESKNYLAWKDAKGSDWDYIKSRSDLEKFAGLETKTKRSKVIGYIKKQTTNAAKRKALWQMAGYDLDSKKNGKTVKNGNYNKYFK